MNEKQNPGLVGQFIKFVNDKKIHIVDRLSSGEFNLFDETEFLDDGVIYVKIQELKKEYMEVSREIQMLVGLTNQTAEEHNRLLNKIDEQNKLRLSIAFLSSNKLEHIDDCLEMTSGINSDFVNCLKALQAYNEGRDADAFLMFHEFFKDKNQLIEHYLINKVFGVLLFREEQYRIAIPFLQKAVEKKPEDIELHNVLMDSYKKTEQVMEEQIEKQIIELLRC